MPKRRFRAEDMYRLKSVTDLDLSPDGRHVAFVLVEPDVEADRTSSSIWVVGTDGSAPPRRFTPGPADASPRWSPDGRSLAYISANPDDTLSAQVQLAALDGGAPISIGELPGPASQLAWSPNSTALAVVCRVGALDPKKLSASERNAPRVVRGLGARLNGVGWKEGRTHVFMVEVGTGSARQLTRGDYDHFDPSFSPDGSMIAFVGDRRPGHDDRQWRFDVWVMAVAGGRSHRLTRGQGYSWAPRFSPDGGLVAFAGTDNDRWDSDSHLFVAPPDASTGPERVAPGTDRPVAMGLPGLPAAHCWTGNRELVMLVVDSGTITLHRARVGDEHSRPMVGGNTEIDFLAARPGRKAIAYTSAWVDQPCELYATRPGDAEPIQLTRLHDDLLTEVELAPAERARVSRPDGTEVEYFTLRPSGPSRRLPVQLDVHGGPQGWWPLARALGLHQAIASAGYLVLLPNPRGSSGYGQESASASTGDWGGADLEDILACCDDLVERGLGDADRMFVSGYSYGGFMAGWTVGHTNRFRAATSTAAVIDMQSFALTTDIPQFGLFNMGGDPWARADEYRLRSPLSYLPKVTTPVLVVHWEGDLRCPIGQAEELYAGLRLLGKKAEFVRYPRGAHGLAGISPSQTVDWVNRMLEWNERNDRRSATGRGRARRAETSGARAGKEVRPATKAASVTASATPG